MSPATSFESASGLRPASAFVVIATVLLAVAAKAAHIAFFVSGEQPRAIKQENAPSSVFDIVDRSGRPLAVSVECFELTLSPQAMWRTHTPRYMAERIGTALGESDPEALLAAMLPPPQPGGAPGTVWVEDPELLAFDRSTAERVLAWIKNGGLADSDSESDSVPEPIPGLWVVESGDEGSWTLAWQPDVTLSEDARRRHLPARDVRRPDVWTRRLLRGLASFVDSAERAEELTALMPRLASLEGMARERLLTDAIWAELLPTRFRIVRRHIEPLVAHRLSLLFKDEAVSAWQMELHDHLDRRHPVRPRVARSEVEERPGDPPDEDDAFFVLGDWGVLSPDVALARARRAAELRPEDLDWSVADPVALHARELASERRPRRGLELLCGTELQQPTWERLLESGCRSYDRRLRSLPRDRRIPWKGDVPNYFETAHDAPEPPRFVTTLDADLQRYAHGVLREVMAEQDPALAMVIALDVESGAVLALDAIHAYSARGFAPLQHVFTPGSTMKAIVMASAIDEGLVAPTDSFPTFAPDGIVVREGRSARHIGEALGAPDEDYVTAETGLSRSVNAVLVQIGLKIPAAELHGRLVRLGYGRRPGAGLGPEAGGRVPPLEDGTWSHCYTHASISFGHELGVTLWQHAAALAAIARGGELREPRLLEAVEQNGVRWNVPTPECGERVFSERTCRTVRGMLATGARSGTGRHVASPEQCPEFAYIGTKTGTTQKVASELCLHVEMEHNLEHEEQGTSCQRGCRRQLVGRRAHERTTCYTSSMCAFGRVSGSEREVLVLVVVDDPRGSAKFGADVAGAATVRMLRRAVGLPEQPGGEPPAEVLALPVGAFNTEDFPWAEVDG